MKSKRTKATDINKKTRQRILERDKWCILCGNPTTLTIAHYIPRSRGGLGIEKNLVVLCMQCHYNFDMTAKRDEIKKQVKKYLIRFYGEINENELIYRRY